MDTQEASHTWSHVEQMSQCFNKRFGEYLIFTDIYIKYVDVTIVTYLFYFCGWILMIILKMTLLVIVNCGKYNQQVQRVPMHLCFWIWYFTHRLSFKWYLLQALRDKRFNKIDCKHLKFQFSKGCNDSTVNVALHNDNDMQVQNFDSQFRKKAKDRQ